MTILSSLYSGVSGLTTNGNALSIIGDNIANVNTIGYKNSRATFADVMASSLGGGGRNQIGQGARLSSVNVQFNQGSFQTTTSPTDLAVDGNGFFVLQDANGLYYTRAGQFYFDKDGILVNPDGIAVQGFMADANGTIIPGALSDINISGVSSQPRATTTVQLDANLDASSTALGTGDTWISGTSAADDATLGNTVLLTVDGNAATVTFAANIANDGAAVAAEIQADVRALGTGSTPWFDNFTATWDPNALTYKLVSGTNASTSAVVVTGGTEAAALNLLGGAVANTTTGAFDTADALATSNFSTALTVIDSLGQSHQITIYFRKDAPNNWSWYSVVPASDTSTGTADEVQARGNLLYTTVGALDIQDTMTSSTGGFDFSGGGAQNQAIIFDFGTSITGSSGTGTDGVTQYGLTSATSFQSQDGYTAGSNRNVSVSSDGIIAGLFSNGRTAAIAQIALGTFQSNEGLIRIGGNLFIESVESGQASTGEPSSGGRGNISSNSLEQSTVDLAQEFVNMITSQRGFQANSRTITTTDELLQELINLKR